MLVNSQVKLCFFDPTPCPFMQEKYVLLPISLFLKLLLAGPLSCWFDYKRY